MVYDNSMGYANPRTELSLFRINKENSTEFSLDFGHYSYLLYLVYAISNPNEIY